MGRYKALENRRLVKAGGRGMIKQIINESQTVQTTFAVDVNGRQVTYEKLNNEFGYILYTVIGVNEDKETAIKESDAAIDTVIETMCAQSYDHGSEWRLVQKEANTDLLDRFGQYLVTAYFEMKDIY
jgi:hypothetical protein